MPKRKKQPLLVSACLLGEKCSYNGREIGLSIGVGQALQQRFDLVAVCPERLGGLPNPRPPAEIYHGDGKAILSRTATVVDCTGRDVTAAFIRGAEATLELAHQSGVNIALLKARSPACGNEQIYNGSFTGTLRNGIGVAAALLETNGIQIFNEEQLDQLFLRESPEPNQENGHASTNS